MVSVHSKKMRESIIKLIKSEMEVFISGVPPLIVSQWLHRAGRILGIEFYRRSKGRIVIIGIAKKTTEKSFEIPHAVSALLDVVATLDGKGEVPLPPILRPCGNPYQRRTLYSAATKIRAMGEYKISIKAMPDVSKPTIMVSKI